MTKPIGTTRAHFSVAVALQRLADANGARFITLSEHARCKLKRRLPYTAAAHSISSHPQGVRLRATRRLITFSPKPL